MFTILGPVSITSGGTTHVLARAQVRGTLGFLLLNTGRVVPADLLVEALWHGAEPSTARNQVQSLVSAVRRRLRELTGSELLTSGPSGYLLRVDADQLDLLMFEDSVRRARTLVTEGQPAAARLVLRAGVALWQGPVLGGAAGAYVEAARQRLNDRLLGATEDLIDVELALGNRDAVVSEFSPLLDAHPLRERLCRQLMLALYQSGRQVESLELYHAFRRALGEEQGLDPGPELRALVDAIHRNDARLAADTAEGTAVVLSKADVKPAQLPADVAGFVGRRSQLTALNALLPDDGDAQGTALTVATITGTAGVGKTALAVRWAHRVRDRFPDGQLFVNLRGYADSKPMRPDEVLARLLHALAVPAQQVPGDLEEAAGLYRSLIADRRMLVVLDNASSPEQVRPVLPGSAGCVVIVTSRDQLTGLVARDGAQQVTLDLLSPDEAHGLLRDLLGARRVQAEPAAAASLAELCARLPLALRIAAANLSRDPDASLDGYVKQLQADHRLAAFTVEGDETTAVRAAFDMSYSSLSATARRLFRLLGLHPGPDITIPATSSLAGVPTEKARHLLAELTRAHLLTQASQGRFALHDLLRTYATDLAATHDAEDERQAATQRMVDHYLHTAYAAALVLDPHRDPSPVGTIQSGVMPAGLTNADQAVAWFTSEHAVLLAIIEQTARTGFDRRTWQLAWALAGFLRRRGHWQDWAATQHTALAAAQRLGDRSAQAYAHRSLARAYSVLARYDDAHGHYQRALELASQLGDQLSQAYAHLTLCKALERQCRYDDALSHSHDALDLFKDAGYRFGEAQARNSVGWFHAMLGNHQQAVDYCEVALTIQQELGHREGQAKTWDSLGYANHHCRRHRQATSCYHQAIDLFQQVGDRCGEASTLVRLGDTYHVAGDAGAARDAWQRALAILDQLADPDADQVRTKLRALSDFAGATPP